MTTSTKGRFALGALLLGLTIGHAAQAQIASAPVAPKINLRPGQPLAGAKGVPVAAPKCGDPAATRIEITLQSRSSATDGDFRMEGIVRNVGLDRYAPSEESVVNLYQVPASGRIKHLASRTFRHLEPNQEVRVVLEKVHLSVATEFFPSYRLEIQHGPDATADCRSNNNRLTRDGIEIRGKLVELLR